MCTCKSTSLHKMQTKEALAESTLFNGQLFDDLYFNYFPNLVKTLVKRDKFLGPPIKIGYHCQQSLPTIGVGIYGRATYDSVTFSDQIPVDEAIHNLMILETTFGTAKDREAALNLTLLILKKFFKSTECHCFLYLFVLAEIRLTQSTIASYAHITK